MPCLRTQIPSGQRIPRAHLHRLRRTLHGVSKIQEMPGVSGRGKSPADSVESRDEAVKMARDEIIRMGFSGSDIDAYRKDLYFNETAKGASDSTTTRDITTRT